MYCQFFGGPLDGWEHYCPRAEAGEYWLARADMRETFFEPPAGVCGPAPLLSPAVRNFARYYLREPGRMLYVNTIHLGRL